MDGVTQTVNAVLSIFTAWTTIKGLRKKGWLEPRLGQVPACPARPGS
jgi:hypothetical protein